MKPVIWTTWITLTIAICGYFAYMMVYAEDKTGLLIGDASHGHFQIEMACTTCHTDAFGGGDVIQEACVNCHETELKAAHDSHPKKKFSDPRNADRLAVLDARYCVTCHTEHQKEQTHPMGLTLPKDYCYHCHQEVIEERESHKDLAFDSCESSGCHNYHDNRALYERFLVENANGPWLNEAASIEEPDAVSQTARLAATRMGLTLVATTERLTTEHWDGHLHQTVGVECNSCHEASDSSHPDWLAKPQPSQCMDCHQQETQGYFQSKHGMRLASGLDPLKPMHSQLSFVEDSMSTEHHCTSCHQERGADPQFSSFAACLGCHNDEHSTAFRASPHGQLALKAFSGELPSENAVTCATCHLPVIEDDSNGLNIRRVQHNQNDTLRPNEKMIRPVCMSCHSLSFSIDALADPALIRNNFSGRPANHVPSIDWALKRESK